MATYTQGAGAHSILLLTGGDSIKPTLRFHNVAISKGIKTLVIYEDQHPRVPDELRDWDTIKYIPIAGDVLRYWALWQKGEGKWFADNPGATPYDKAGMVLELRRSAHGEFIKAYAEAIKSLTTAGTVHIVFCYVLSGATGLATLYGQLESLALGMTDVLETLRQERHSFRYYLLGIIPAFLQMDGSTTNMRQLNAGLQFIRELRSHCNLYKPQHIILCNEARMFGHSFFRIADVAVTRDFLETLTHDFTRFGPETWANCGSIPLGS